ncbi:hypothetical protein ACA910_004641 [Epithemia clementina (nom. ined.)]
MTVTNELLPLVDTVMMMDKSIFGASENAEDDDNADNQKEVSFDQKCTKKLVKQQHHVAFAQVIMATTRCGQWLVQYKKQHTRFEPAGDQA